MSAAAASPVPSTPAAPPPAPPSAAPVPEATPPAAAAPAPVASVFDGLPVEIKGAPSLAKFKGLEDLAKSYLELETKIGAKGLIVPGKDAPQHELDAFHAALGRPEKADGYAASKFTPPEGLPWNAELLPALLPEMHKLGISDAQASGLVDAYAKAQDASYRAGVTQVEQQKTAAEQSLRREWGNAYDAKADVAKRALMAFAGKGADTIATMRLSDGSALGDHPAILKLFASVGEGMGEHPLLGDATRRMTMTPDEAEREIQKLQNDPESRKILLDDMHPDHASLMARRSSLFKAKTGG